MHFAPHALYAQPAGIRTARRIRVRAFQGDEIVRDAGVLQQKEAELLLRHVALEIDHVAAHEFRRSLRAAERHTERGKPRERKLRAYDVVPVHIALPVARRLFAYIVH